MYLTAVFDYDSDKVIAFHWSPTSTDAINKENEYIKQYSSERYEISTEYKGYSKQAIPE